MKRIIRHLSMAALALMGTIMTGCSSSDATSGDITGSIKGLTISDGTDTYTVNRSAAAGPIYVAVKPQSSTTFYVSATDGTNAYTKTLAGRQYAAGKGYNINTRFW